MPIKTYPFDAAEFLNSAEAVQEYLIGAFEDAYEFDDAGQIAEALGVVARAKGMTELAEKANLSRASLYKSLSAEGRPELPTLLKVMKALGLRLVPVRVDDLEAASRSTLNSAA